mgnify:CR=1 FL=1
MSSVSSSAEKKAYSESAKKNSDKKTEQQNNVTAKHRKEIKSLAQKYSEEMEELKGRHQQEMGQLKARANETLSKRDRKNIEDITDVRNVHRQQLEKTARENEERIDALKNQYQTENQKQKKSADRQLETKDKNFEGAAAETNKKFEEYSESMREGMKEGLDRQREKIENKYTKEAKLLIEGRDEQLQSAREANRRTRTEKDAQIARLEQIKREQKENLTNDYVVKVDEERKHHAADNENRREVYKESVDQLRERYRKALDTEKIENAENQGGFKRGVEGRLGEQVRNLERRVHQMKTDNAATEIELKKGYERQKQNLKTAFQLNVEDFEKQRNESVDLYKDVAHKDVLKAKKDFDRTLKMTNNYYKGELNSSKLRSDEVDDQNREEYARMKDHLSQRMEKRVATVQTGLQLENKKSQEYFNDSLEQMKEVQYDTIAEVRENLNRDKKDAVGHLRENLRKNSMKSNEQLIGTKLELEKKLQSIADDNERRMRSLKWESDRVLKEQAKQSKMSLEMKDQQYKTKMAQMQDEYKKNVDVINKNHQDEVTKLIIGQKKV